MQSIMPVPAQSHEGWTGPWIESVALFVFGIVLMSYIYAASAPSAGLEIGAPGHDSFYHIRMAALLPEVGLVREFPWLRFAYFTRTGSEFVSHHVGFHVLLLPFVRLAELLGADELAGGRWATSAFFGGNLVLFNLLLRAGRVRYRWFWLALLLLLPVHFYTRHAFVRAIGPSLLLMQVLLLLLVQQRYLWAGAACVLYVHLYLGAVTYIPVLVALFAVAELAAPRDERRWPWRLVWSCAGGWLIGVCTYPYARGMAEFLVLQVTGTGLTPDIEVGTEWRPYSSIVAFATIARVALGVWGIALVGRLSTGPRLRSGELGLLLVAIAFLLLTLKARRFIEYWPLLAVLSAAYLSRPLQEYVEAGWARILAQGGRGPWPAATLVAVAGVCGAVILMWAARVDMLRPVLVEWRVWIPVLLLLILPALCRAWRGAGYAVCGRWGQGGGVFVSGVVGGAWLYATAWLGGVTGESGRLQGAVFLWSMTTAFYALTPAVMSARRSAARLTQSVAQTTGAFAAVLALAGGIVLCGGADLATVARQTTCRYDLAAIRALMAFLEHDSQPGDVIFTDDWDVFPVLFFHNTRNHYIVGLDPKFTHERRPDLWERFVRITRGQTPYRAVVPMPTPDGGREKVTIDIALEDIRDHFGARYVITDRDHHRLAQQLRATPQFAELVFPSRSFERVSEAPYLLFRVRTATGEQPASDL
ncbi:MAG: hypothetical protein IPM18_11105 [Phycisphaerales bacterium]|nr:hypothetical protein [Phycisphaerales bacterium]